MKTIVGKAKQIEFLTNGVYFNNNPLLICDKTIVLLEEIKITIDNLLKDKNSILEEVQKRIENNKKK